MMSLKKVIKRRMSYQFGSSTRNSGGVNPVVFASGVPLSARFSEIKERQDPPELQQQSIQRPFQESRGDPRQHSHSQHSHYESSSSSRYHGQGQEPGGGSLYSDFYDNSRVQANPFSHVGQSPPVRRQPTMSYQQHEPNSFQSSGSFLSHEARQLVEPLQMRHQQSSRPQTRREDVTMAALNALRKSAGVAKSKGPVHSRLGLSLAQRLGPKTGRRTGLLGGAIIANKPSLKVIQRSPLKASSGFKKRLGANMNNNTMRRGFTNSNGRGGRGGNTGGRGGGGRRFGTGGNATGSSTKEDLDNELDSYMSKTKTSLDKELEDYMSHKALEVNSKGGEEVVMEAENEKIEGDSTMAEA